MHPNAQLLTRFYEAFATRRGDDMAACYADDATFGDPVFPHLDAAHVRGMWRMFCQPGGAEVRVESSGIEADDTKGRAHWEAWYNFSATGRPVHNVIDAEFTFRDGLIATHHDTFDFYRWSRQALGPTGWLLGWSPIVRNKVQAGAAAQLEKFLAKGV